ncbi:hypothetical protein KVT40_005029 [Elsinoe batatas]|uniref:Uncharacterized protein n=1 Tax=Elsinoe batatas TaxID=2601811 RepID=A0A8K0L4G3_9PEZI|nr:hypothetical protein KVT40_005029 [Elsinoe batatas]
MDKVLKPKIEAMLAQLKKQKEHDESTKNTSKSKENDKMDVDSEAKNKSISFDEDELRDAATIRNPLFPLLVREYLDSGVLERMIKKAGTLG